MKEVLIIIPAYNEAKNIVNVVDNIILNFPEYDYVVVNDGSRDATSKICHDHKYNIIDLAVNLGLAGAFQTGLKYAHRMGYSYAIQYDGDGQHLAQYIRPLYNKIRDGYDIVIGSRFVTEKKPRNFRMFGSNIISTAMRFSTGVRLTDPTSGMRMFSRKMIQEFASNINYGPEPDTLSFLIKNGASVAEVQVEMQERIAGTSYLNLTNSVLYMARMMVSILLIQNFRKREN